MHYLCEYMCVYMGKSAEQCKEEADENFHFCGSLKLAASAGWAGSGNHLQPAPVWSQPAAKVKALLP